MLKVGQNQEISSFFAFLRFLTNFIIMYNGQKFYAGGIGQGKTGQGRKVLSREPEQKRPEIGEFAGRAGEDRAG